MVSNSFGSALDRDTNDFRDACRSYDLTADLVATLFEVPKSTATHWLNKNRSSRPVAWKLTLVAWKTRLEPVGAFMAICVGRRLGADAKSVERWKSTGVPKPMRLAAALVWYTDPLCRDIVEQTDHVTPDSIRSFARRRDMMPHEVYRRIGRS